MLCTGALTGGLLWPSAASADGLANSEAARSPWFAGGESTSLSNSAPVAQLAASPGSPADATVPESGKPPSETRANPPLPPEPEHKRDTRGTFTFTWENDRFAATDRHYTNGFRASYLTPPLPTDHWADDVADFLPGLNPIGATLVGFSIGQSIFTPSDTSATQRITDDRPYAGWTYGGIALMSATDDTLQTLALDIGVVGPYAGGEEVQNTVHTLIDVDTADGWSHQLTNEPGVVLTYEHKWRAPWAVAPGWLEFDVTPYLGGAVGNVFTYGAAGATLRIGADLPNDFGAPRIRPSLPGSNYFEAADDFGWYFFIGGEGRAIARNIFLDGNTFGPDRSDVTKHPLVGEWQFGAVVTVFDVRLAATYVVNTREFRGQDQPDQFGALSASFKF